MHVYMNDPAGYYCKSWITPKVTRYRELIHRLLTCSPGEVLRTIAVRSSSTAPTSISIFIIPPEPWWPQRYTCRNSLFHHKGLACSSWERTSCDQYHCEITFTNFSYHSKPTYLDPHSCVASKLYSYSVWYRWTHDWPSRLDFATGWLLTLLCYCLKNSEQFHSRFSSIIQGNRADSRGKHIDSATSRECICLTCEITDNRSQEPYHWGALFILRLTYLDTPNNNISPSPNEHHEPTLSNIYSAFTCA